MVGVVKVGLIWYDDDIATVCPDVNIVPLVLDAPCAFYLRVLSSTHSGLCWRNIRLRWKNIRHPESKRRPRRIKRRAMVGLVAGLAGFLRLAVEIVLGLRLDVYLGVKLNLTRRSLPVSEGATENAAEEAREDDRLVRRETTDAELPIQETSRRYSVDDRRRPRADVLYGRRNQLKGEDSSGMCKFSAIFLEKKNHLPTIDNEVTPSFDNYGTVQFFFSFCQKYSAYFLATTVIRLLEEDVHVLCQVSYFTC